MSERHSEKNTNDAELLWIEHLCRCKFFSFFNFFSFFCFFRFYLFFAFFSFNLVIFIYFECFVHVDSYFFFLLDMLMFHRFQWFQLYFWWLFFHIYSFYLSTCSPVVPIYSDYKCWFYHFIEYLIAISFQSYCWLTWNENRFLKIPFIAFESIRSITTINNNPKRHTIIHSIELKTSLSLENVIYFVCLLTTKQPRE